MVRDSGVKYDRILFVRPDMVYLSPITEMQLLKAEGNIVCVPQTPVFALKGFKFRGHNTPRFNDRFAICSAESYEAYGCLFDRLLEHSRVMPLYSEGIVWGDLTIVNKVRVAHIDVRALIVRANGKVEKNYWPGAAVPLASAR